MSDGAREALLNAGYNLGCEGLLNFTDALSALAQGDLDGFAAGLRDSKWYSEVPGRVEEIIALVKG